MKVSAPEPRRFMAFFLRRMVLATVLLLCAIATCISAEPPGLRVRASGALDRSENLSCELRGPVRGYIDRIITNWLLKAPTQNPAMLQMFADREKKPPPDLLPWSGEFAGKYLTASTQILRLTRNDALAVHLRAFVHQLIALQDANGYLGPFPSEYQLSGRAPNVRNSGTWDAWGHYHAMIGLLMWHELNGDDEALAAAQKIGDLLCARFLGERKVSDIGSPDQNQSVIHGLTRLFETTGKREYCDLALEIVQEFATPGAGDYLRTALEGKEFYATPKPRWESLHSIMGLAELYRITGTEEYRRAFEHIWWSIVKLDRHNNGGFSSGEQAVGNPYHPGAIETCCTIAWVAMSIDMLHLTGNSVVADEIELSTLNSVVGLHSPDGIWSTYNTPMDGRRIPSTTDISFQIRPGSEQLNCCSVNAARGFGMISDWALMKETGRVDNHETLVINWFGPSLLATMIDGVQVTLTQETTYPNGGHILLRVDSEKPVAFTLKVRVPYWSAKSSVTVDGHDEQPPAGSYYAITRQWRSGDRIDIDLDMRLRAWVGERECTGKVALYRGPLLLAHENQAKSDDALPPLDIRTTTSKAIADAPENGVVFAMIEVNDATGRTIQLRDFGTAGQKGVPYISWLPAKNIAALEFSKRNPLRSRPVKP